MVIPYASSNFCKHLTQQTLDYKVLPRKFYIRRNKNKVNSTETGPTVIADLISGSDQENCSTSCLLLIIIFHRYCFTYKHCSLIYKHLSINLNDLQKNLLNLKVPSTFWPFQLPLVPELVPCWPINSDKDFCNVF